MHDLQKPEKSKNGKPREPLKTRKVESDGSKNITHHPSYYHREIASG